MLKIITHPNPFLRQKSLSVIDVFDEEIKKLIPQMIETMVKQDGVGLAAPQIGKSIQLIVIYFKESTLVIINPKIIKKSFSKVWGEEGCLSVPDKFGEVKRHKKITIIYTNENGQKQQLAAKDMLARVIQHEIDHLNGILFIDKARKIQTINPQIHE
jgi:peptide deformylase